MVPMRVLLVEDKPRMAELMERALRGEGHSVVLAYDGQKALEIGMAESLDAIILDISLPKLDGFSVMKSLRDARCATPTIMVTARDAMADVVRGLDLGADDYLTKPFALDVLLARLRAVSRRSPVVRPADLQFEDLKLNAGTQALERRGRVAPLTRTEFVLMETLIRRAGTIVPRGVLADAGWGIDAEVSDSTLYVFIRALRAKIAQGDEIQLLHTARGIGYALRACAH